jgi:hypothetical protein
VDPGSCLQCQEHLSGSPHLTGACASVGIEHGKPTQRMLREYLTAFHERGHVTGRKDGGAAATAR